MTVTWKSEADATTRREIDTEVLMAGFGGQGMDPLRRTVDMAQIS